MQTETCAIFELRICYETLLRTWTGVGKKIWSHNAVTTIILTVSIIFRFSYLTDAFLLLNQAGCCCIYIIFVGKNSKYVLDQWMGGNVALELYILVVGLLSVMILMVRDLKYLAPFSIVATIVQLCVFGVVGYYISTDLPKFCDHTQLFVGPLKVPIFFGTTVFALIAIGVV